MMKKMLPLFGIVLLALLALSLRFPVGAAPLAQFTPFPTPTPGADGRILYEVQPGDTLFGIASTAGISVDELRTLNGFSEDETVVIVGQILLLGLAAPAEEPTEEVPAVEPTPAEPTPTLGPGSGTICILLYEDVNGDGLRQEEELRIGGGAVSVSEREGLYSNSLNTVGGPVGEGELESVCFEDIPEGDYNITVAIPSGYNATTDLNRGVELPAGGENILNFGAQLSSQAQTGAPSPEEGGRSPILGVIGLALILAGVGLGIFSLRLGRR